MYDAAIPNDVNAEVLLDKTLQELRMLSSVTNNCQVLSDRLNLGSQLSEL